MLPRTVQTFLSAHRTRLTIFALSTKLETSYNCPSRRRRLGRAPHYQTGFHHVASRTHNRAMGDKIEVLVHGLGAIGAFYAFILQRCKNVRLSVVARSNYEVVKATGMLVKSENHGEHHFHPAATVKTPGEAGHAFDFIVCCNKATSLDYTAEQFAPVVDQDRTTIVLMQNGVGNEDPFHKRFPKCSILSGVVSCTCPLIYCTLLTEGAQVWIGGSQESPGVVRQHLAEGTEIGLFSHLETSPARQQGDLDRFTALLAEGGTPFDVRAEIQTSRWKKVVWNAAWNSLTALSAVDAQGWLTSSDYALKTTRRLMEEAIHVAQAIGVPGVEEALIDELIPKMQALKGPVYTSMYYDTKAGRAMEVEVILGTIVEKAREQGVPVPTVETLYALLLAVDQRMERERETAETTK
jgi:ketopantoate reductase